MKTCLEAGMDPMIDIRNFPDAPPDATLKRKRISNKNDEWTSYPPSFPAKQPKKIESPRRILRFAATEASEDQRREVDEVVNVVKASEAAKVVEVAEVVEDARVIEESRHLNNEAKKEFVEVFTLQNSCKSSNAETYTIYDFLNVNTSSIPFPITTITNPINDLKITNALETNGPENITSPQNIVNPISQ